MRGQFGAEYWGLFERNFQSHPVASIRQKYNSAVYLYTSQYPVFVKGLLDNNFDPRFLSPTFNWEEVLKRHPEDYSYVRNPK